MGELSQAGGRARRRERAVLPAPARVSVGGGRGGGGSLQAMTRKPNKSCILARRVPAVRAAHARVVRAAWTTGRGGMFIGGRLKTRYMSTTTITITRQLTGASYHPEKSPNPPAFFFFFSTP